MMIRMFLVITTKTTGLTISYLLTKYKNLYSETPQLTAHYFARPMFCMIYAIKPYLERLLVLGIKFSNKYNKAFLVR